MLMWQPSVWYELGLPHVTAFTVEDSPVGRCTRSSVLSSFSPVRTLEVPVVAH